MNELDSVVLYVIDQTSKVAKQYSQRQFDLLGLGITVDQWVLLKVIEEKKSLSQVALAQESRRDPASITRSLDLLQKKGLITRDAIVGNRRQYNIALSKEGVRFVSKNMSLVKKLRADSIKGLTKNDLQSLVGMLHIIQKNMS